MSDNIKTQLPDDVLDFLSGIEAVRFAQGFVKTFGMKPEAVPLVMVFAEDVVYGDIQLDQLPAELTKRFAIDAAKANQAAIELAEARLLPIEAHVGDVRGQIKKWGGDTSALPASLEPMVTAESFVHSVVVSLPGSMPAHLQHRLEHLLVLYLTKHSDKSEILGLLSRSEKTGGMDFEKKDAQTFLEFFDEKKAAAHLPEFASAEFSSKPVVAELTKKMDIAQPVVNILAPIAPAAPVVRSVPPVAIVEQKVDPVVKSAAVQTVNPIVPSELKTDALAKEDEAEIEKVKVEKKQILEMDSDAMISISQMIEMTCKQPSMQFADELLFERCKQIVGARLRDVRSAPDTQKLLERSLEAGGLGVSGKKLSDMMQSIEQSVDRLAKQSAQKVVEDRREMAVVKQTRAEEETNLADKEQKMMTKRYVELTGKMPSNHIDSASPTLARVSAAVSVADTLQAREQKIDTTKVRTVIEETKKEKEYVPAPAVRPTVADVQFVRRLSGPIDELRAMTITDFRRLAKDTSSCAERVKDQIDLMGDQGFEKRVEAIRAWQTSPLYQAYVSIMGTAMDEGKPLEVVRLEKEHAGGLTLSKEELASLLRLNSELRF